MEQNHERSSTQRYAGPFNRIPFENFMQLPIGIVPKAGNKTRLIFQLSHDFFETDTSLNHNTPKELCSVCYRDLDYAITVCLNMMKNKVEPDSELHFSKTDAQSAFRVLPIKVSQRCWLVMMAENPETGNKCFF